MKSNANVEKHDFFYNTLLQRLYIFALSHLLFRDPSQTSSPVQMKRGKAYYIEALLKQDIWENHIAVGVKLPSRTLQRPISQEDIFIRPPGMANNTFGTKFRILL